MQQNTTEQNANYNSNTMTTKTEEIKTETPILDVKNEKTEIKPTVSSEKSNDDDADDKKLLATEIKEELTEKDGKVKDDGIPYDWAVELMKNYTPDLIENSAKMEIFFCILEETIRLNDRMLIFSQSLLTLNLIERFLQSNPTEVTENSIKWAKNVNYYRKYKKRTQPKMLISIIFRFQF